MAFVGIQLQKTRFTPEVYIVSTIACTMCGCAVVGSVVKRSVVGVQMTFQKMMSMRFSVYVFLCLSAVAFCQLNY